MFFSGVLAPCAWVWQNACMVCAIQNAHGGDRRQARSESDTGQIAETGCIVPETHPKTYIVHLCTYVCMYVRSDPWWYNTLGGLLQHYLMIH